MTTNKPSFVQGETASPLLNLTIGELLAEASGSHPDHTAVVSCQQRIRLTYGQLETLSDNMARGLIDIGLQPGERIGIWSPNNIEWLITMYAAAKAGLVLVNINPAYRPTELEYALRKVSCRAMVLANTFKSSNYPAMIRTLAPEIQTSVPGRLHCTRLPDLRTLVLIGDASEDGFLSFDEIVRAGAHSPAALRPLQENCSVHDPVNIQFTSGTTGSPKGATLTHHNIVNNAFFVGCGIRLSSADCVCAPVPLYHCFGMVMGALACAAHNATLVLPGEAFEPLTTLRAVAEEKCTALYGVPTMFRAILDHPQFRDFNVASLRTGIVAGSLCPSVLMERIVGQLKIAQITNCYGMTETSPVSFQTAVDDSFEKRVTTVGRVHPHVQVKIVDANGKIVPRGERGGICTKGYSIMQGYWDDNARTSESIIDGWMLTGDEGVLDDDGYCAIVGRIKDTIIRGGENIAPKEVEDFLTSHVEIVEAEVFGIPDDVYGEVVCAWIRKVPGSTLSRRDVQNYCRHKIAHYKVPSVIRFVDQFPLTVTGKVQKYVMREEMVNEQCGGEERRK